MLPSSIEPLSLVTRKTADSMPLETLAAGPRAKSLGTCVCTWWVVAPLPLLARRIRRALTSLRVWPWPWRLSRLCFRSALSRPR